MSGVIAASHTSEVCAGTARPVRRRGSRRLASLARLHESRVVVIGGRPVSAPALGTLVSVRIETRRAHLGAHRFALEHDAVRYKSHLAPPHGHTVHRAPRGFMERRAH